MKYTNSVILAAVLSTAGSAIATEPDYANLIAHRGESHDAPENTLPAYRTAVERGFGFECDVYLSADGRVFTFHDGNLKRTSGGTMTKNCTEANWETEISKLNVGGWGRWKGSRFDPTRPALLEEVCALARPGRFIYCEVKGGDTNVVGAIAAVLEKQTVAEPGNFLFIAFSETICAELKRQLPKFRVYWLTNAHHYTWYADRPPLKGAPVTVEEILKVLESTRTDGVDIGYDPELHTPEFIGRIRKAGYGFHVWTIDDPDRAREALRRGAQTVTTNRAKFIRDHFTAERP